MFRTTLRTHVEIGAYHTLTLSTFPTCVTDPYQMKFFTRPDGHAKIPTFHTSEVLQKGDQRQRRVIAIIIIII